jgi:hypothetical protein
MEDKVLLERIRNGVEKKDEMIILDKFINNYVSDDQYDDYYYSEFFNFLISNRICLINQRLIILN